MDRYELGRLLYETENEVHESGVVWINTPSSMKELFAKSAERFIARALAQGATGRTFHARIALMGHRSLGLCRVTEAPLAGVTMLRCEKDGVVEWVNPAAVYSVAEVPDAVAASEIAEALRRVQEKLDAEAKRAADLRAARNAATVDVVVDREGSATGVVASDPYLLRKGEAMLETALIANGFGDLRFFTLHNESAGEIGIVFCTADDIAERLVATMFSLGFSIVRVRTATDDELVSSIPF